MAPTTPNFSRPLGLPRETPPEPVPKEMHTSQKNKNESETSPSAASKAASDTAFFPLNKVKQLRALSRGEKSGPEPELEPQRSLTRLRNDIGAMDKPIMEFRPELWPVLDRNRPILNLDLFWPIKAEDMANAEEQNSDGDQKGNFPFKELRPLVSFRNLHVLHLGGMMRSYQPIIWEACFVNPNLTKLTLEMALEPEISDDFKAQYKKIDSNWAFDGSKPCYTEPTEYLGSEGSGELHPEFGCGEYLDRTAMKQAQAAVKEELPAVNKRHLPVQTLTLSNFAVDAGPFFRWFDPERLKEVIFKGTCWDAGFYLPNEMRRVVVVSGPQKPKPVVARVIKPGELKVVTLSKGKVVKREDWDGKNHLPDPEAGVGGGVGGGGKGLKSKVSQMLGVGKKATKE